MLILVVEDCPLSLVWQSGQDVCTGTGDGILARKQQGSDVTRPIILRTLTTHPSDEKYSNPVSCNNPASMR